VTSFYVSGAVRFPVDLRRSRRYEEVTQHWPGRAIPRRKKERARLHKAGDAVLLEDPAFVALHRQFRTKIRLAIDLIEAAIRHKVPFGVLLVDGWYLAEEVVQVAERRHKAWISILKKNRNLATTSFLLKDADGRPIPLAGPLIPPSASRALPVGEQTYWCFTLVVRVPALGKVRRVLSFQHADLSGTYVVLVTNHREWRAPRIIATYLLRWPPATFYQDSKGHLGLDTYRMRSTEAMENHGCLVFVAYSFAHLAGLPPPLVGRFAPINTIGEGCRQHAAALLQSLILHAPARLLGGVTIEDGVASLFAKQRRVLCT
jgi:Transposase DDE domain